MNNRFTRLAAGTLLLGATAIAAPMSVAADDDELGAYVYAASCDSLTTDAIMEDIGDLGMDDDSQMEWQMLGNGQEAPTELYTEDEGMDNVVLDDLLAEPHAVAIHETDDENAAVIACGDITGTPENDTLLIQLSEVDGSGFEGRAYFAPDDTDNELDVIVGAWAAGEVEPLGTPSSTPVS